MTARFNFCKLPLSGLFRVERKSIDDRRGFLSRVYCVEEFAEFGLETPIAHVNLTLTRKRGTVRGMHFQYPPYGESKLITCMQGKVLDVAVDIRKDSSTFLQWHAEMLSEDQPTSILLLEGYAHGFQALTDNAQLLYLHSKTYSPDAEGGLNARDPLLNIEWPINIMDISDRDRDFKWLDAGFKGIEI